AWPLAVSGTLLARTVLPSWKETVPLVTGSAPVVTVAVKVTDWPYTDVGADDPGAVAVAWVKLASAARSLLLRKSAAWPPKPVGVPRALASAMALASLLAWMVKVASSRVWPGWTVIV